MSIGSAWTGLNPSQQQQLTDGFVRFSTANYAANFSDFTGEKFEITGTQPSQNGRVIVETRLTSPGDQPVTLLGCSGDFLKVRVKKGTGWTKGVCTNQRTTCA